MKDKLIRLLELSRTKNSLLGYFEILLENLKSELTYAEYTKVSTFIKEKIIGPYQEKIIEILLPNFDEQLLDRLIDFYENQEGKIYTEIMVKTNGQIEEEITKHFSQVDEFLQQLI